MLRIYKSINCSEIGNKLLKKGDTVVCVNNDGYKHNLTEHKEYEVAFDSILQTYDDLICVIDDMKIQYYFNTKRFALRNESDMLNICADCLNNPLNCECECNKIFNRR